MFPSDSQGVGLPGGAARAGLCAALALLFALGGDRLVGIESGFYDFCQRLSASATTAPVIIVEPGADSGDLWSLPELDELIGELKAAGARVIVPAAPAPAATAADEVGRLQSLIRLEQRVGAPNRRAEAGLLERQLADATRRLTHQQSVASAMQSAGNVVLGLPTTEPRPGLPSPTGSCIQRVAAASGGYADLAASRRATARLVPAAASLCDAAAAIGHARTDFDGVSAARRPYYPPIPRPCLPARSLRSSGRRMRLPTSPADSIRRKRARAFRLFLRRRARRCQPGMPSRSLCSDRNSGPAPARPVRRPRATAVLPCSWQPTFQQLRRFHHPRPVWAFWLEIGLALLLALRALLRKGSPSDSRRSRRRYMAVF